MAKKAPKGNRPFEGLGKLAKDRKEAARAVAAKHMKEKHAPVAKAPTSKQPSKTPKEPPKEEPTPDAPTAYSYEDRVAFSQAFSGVAPLGTPAPKAKRKSATKKPARDARAQAVAESRAKEEAARKRLDQLVSGGIRFVVERSDGVEGRRSDASARTVRMLRHGELPPEASLDLHGKTRAEVGPALRAFVRDAHKRGRLTLAIIHGKGKHSEGGVGVLRDAAVAALTKGGAAPLVDAFATAPDRFGGEGALLVRLRAR
ncbi:MAG: Smr/MutS family protein [Myxococcota bacterium]